MEDLYRQVGEIMVAAGGSPIPPTDTFGKSARYTTQQNYMRMIDKKEALEILMKAEEDGLVHKAYHPNFYVTNDETSVCNCCKCSDAIRLTESERIVRIAPPTPKKEIDSWVKEKL